MSKSRPASQSIYLPDIFTIGSVSELSPTEKLFRLEFPAGKSFMHKPGQFIQLSLAGYGEAPISISNSPTRGGYLELGIRQAGTLTGAMHRLKPGDNVGVRGPFGSCFEVGGLRSNDLLLIAGGCGMAPLRSLIQYCEDRRKEFGRVTILYGAKTPADLLYKDELSAWENSDSLDCLTTVDSDGGDASYRGHTGFVPALIEPLAVDPDNTRAVIVGPPLMYRPVIGELRKKGLEESRITVSLERHMKCGIGKCGHCAIEHLYCCLDGPVFPLQDVSELWGAL
ncbi:MAG: oxidoreductase [Candidatus Glassbacteria bacterium]|nr:oxidoreductase [Candidatus Glassbacteria bacterium]